MVECNVFCFCFLFIYLFINFLPENEVYIFLQIVSLKWGMNIHNH